MEDPNKLNNCIRSTPLLTPGDSLHRAIEMLRESPVDSLPVIDRAGGLAGVISAREFASLLEDPDLENTLMCPVAKWIRVPSAIGGSDISLSQAKVLLARSGETALPIVDDGGSYVGMVTAADLLVPDRTPPRPPSIGGMATPWGVYLTNGSIQAGVGNGALAGSGALLGILMALSYVGIGAVAWAVQQASGFRAFDLWNAEPPSAVTASNVAWFVLQGLSLPLFLLMMRALPLAGYHAAEHQVVHAMERNEPLDLSVVSRMPRVHPRCGTNLMAGVLVFGLVSKMLPALQIGLGAMDSTLIGAMAALFTWRSVGAVLQQHFTTRPPSQKQLASGIAAAMDLDHKYLNTALKRPSFVRKLWCMGFPQMALGSSATFSGLLYAIDLTAKWLK